MGMYTLLHYDFALRTKSNLEFIEKAYQEGTAGVYNATQWINSLLGMIIFLKEGRLVPAIPLCRFCLCSDVQVIRDDNNDCSRVNRFVRRFRNTIAHCGFDAFGSKDDIQGFIMHDQRPGQPIDWKIRITTQGIREVALGLVDYIINYPSNIEAA